MIAHCEQRGCYHNILGICEAERVTFQHWDGDFNNILECTLYEAKDELELPSVSLQESMDCDEHNGRNDDWWKHIDDTDDCGNSR